MSHRTLSTKHDPGALRRSTTIPRHPHRIPPAPPPQRAIGTVPIPTAVLPAWYGAIRPNSVVGEVHARWIRIPRTVLANTRTLQEKGRYGS